MANEEFCASWNLPPYLKTDCLYSAVSGPRVVWYHLCGNHLPTALHTKVTDLAVCFSAVTYQLGACDSALTGREPSPLFSHTL
jgi:hypothetical protein